MRKRFEALWKRCRLTGSNVGHDAAWEVLAEHYNEPRRRYHGPRHLDHCLGEFDLASGEMAHPDAVEMALWFHDAVGVPDGEFNEARSAELFQCLAADSFEPAFVDDVKRLILATEHRDSPDCCDDPWIVDIDLSSLALPWQEYMRDNAALREELKEMPDEQYYAGKRRFLQGLLDRERIYTTGFFHRRCEARARENIRRFLRVLGEGRIDGAGDAIRV